MPTRSGDQEVAPQDAHPADGAATGSLPPADPPVDPAGGLPDDLPGDATAARLAVYRALEHLQVVPDHEGGRARLERWAEQARAAGWPGVRAHVMHALLVNDLFGDVGPQALLARADAFRDAAEATGDDVMVAWALGGRLTFLGVSDPDAVEDRPGDLARAVAMLDEVFESDPGSLAARAGDLGASYNECAQSYHVLELWELEQEMYDRSRRAFGLVPADDPMASIVDIASRALALNRFDSTAAAVCALLGAGRDDEARDVATVCGRPADEDYAALPGTWAASLRAVVRLLDAVAAGTQGAVGFRTVPPDLWDLLADAAWQGYRGLLLLSAAVAARGLGETDEAADLAERSIGCFDLYRPSFKNLAFRLAAGRTDGPQDAALRWAVHQADLRHEARLQVLAAARARLSSERVVRYGERLRRQAYVDELTGVANRHALNEHLGRLRAGPAERRLCVALVDLDRFKEVNDRFGHAVGDDVLRALGRLLTATVRGGDLAVRLGGDEFVLLLPVAGAGRWERRLAALVERVRRHDWEGIAAGLHVTVSVGTAAGPASTVDDLLRDADENLYRAKAAGRDRLVG